MLQYSGKVFFRVAAIDRKQNSNPTVFLDIIERESQRFIGQIRYNFDPRYSKSITEIRMSFDVVINTLIAPIRGGEERLEDIVVGGMLWLMKDNHYTYDFVPKVYMVVHSYEQDESIVKDINNKIIEILFKLGAQQCVTERAMLEVKAEDIDYTYVERIINRY